MFKCSVCGYIFEGPQAPDACPKCGAPKEKFAELTGDVKDKVEKSRMTNDLHMDMLAHLQEIEAISLEGIDENLDPGCVAIFKKAAAAADELSRSIRAELAGHMSKGKWG